MALRRRRTGMERPSALRSVQSAPGWVCASIRGWRAPGQAYWVRGSQRPRRDGRAETEAPPPEGHAVPEADGHDAPRLLHHWRLGGAIGVRRSRAGIRSAARMPDANGAPTTTPTPRSAQSGSSSSRASWLSNVYGMATRKKSSGKRSRKRGIIPVRLMPAPMARISPRPLERFQRGNPPPSDSSRQPRFDPRLGLVVAQVEIVDEQRVDGGQAQAGWRLSSYERRTPSRV